MWIEETRCCCCKGTGWHHHARIKRRSGMQRRRRVSAKAPLSFVFQIRAVCLSQQRARTVDRFGGRSIRRYFQSHTKAEPESIVNNRYHCGWWRRLLHLLLPLLLAAYYCNDTGLMCRELNTVSISALEALRARIWNNSRPFIHLGRSFNAKKLFSLELLQAINLLGKSHRSWARWRYRYSPMLF